MTIDDFGSYEAFGRYRRRKRYGKAGYALGYDEQLCCIVWGHFNCGLRYDGIRGEVPVGRMKCERRMDEVRLRLRWSLTDLFNRGLLWKEGLAIRRRMRCDNAEDWSSTDIENLTWLAKLIQRVNKFEGETSSSYICLGWQLCLVIKRDDWSSDGWRIYLYKMVLYGQAPIDRMECDWGGAEFSSEVEVISSWFQWLSFA